MRGYEIEAVAARAGDVGRTLRTLGNGKRLEILCRLMQLGEANVGQLAEAVGLSMSALSQHLGKLRAEHLVATRRDSQTIWYRIGDGRVDELIGALHTIYCGAK